MLRLHHLTTDQRSNRRQKTGTAARPLAARRRGRRPLLEILEDRKLLAGNIYTVNGLLDTGVGSLANGDLRYCVDEANANPGSTIDFAIGLTGTITLTSSLDLKANVTIDSPLAPIAVSGGGKTTVFKVEPGVTARISGLTITDGHGTQGGGVFNEGHLTLVDCTISGNTAFAAGGGVQNYYGSLLLDNDTITGNTAGNGGGVYIFGGSATLVNNTIVANTAPYRGRQFISVGGLFVVGLASLKVDNTIVFGNGEDFGSSTETPMPTLSHDMIVANPTLAPLGFYGGLTETMPLLPGSAAIDAGDDSLTLAPGNVLTTDQRGEPRIFGGTVDIGAFESQGFQLTPVAGSTPQTEFINGAFANALSVAVTANNSVEPVNGGKISFVVPALGASATLSTTNAIVAGGRASVTATANSTSGAYTVDATAIEGSTSFTLTNGLTYLVDNTGDAGIGFGTAGDLRYCVNLANDSIDSTILLPSGLGNIQLTSGLSLNASVAITGPGGSLAVEGGKNLGQKNFSLFTVDPGVTAIISGLTIADGVSESGGGIDNEGTLTLLDDTVASNSGAIGGGIVNSGSLTLLSDTFSSNSAVSGGGVFNYGLAFLADDTFASNSADESGGGIYDDSDSTATLINDTFAMNTAAGTGFGNGGSDVYNDGTLNVDNSILYDGTSAPDIENSWQVSGGYNLIGNVVNVGFGTAILTNPVAGNPLLAAPGSYGGPTQTLALLPGSPAIQAGNPALAVDADDVPLATDGRGLPRKVGNAVDLGAFESSGFTLAVVAGNNQSSPAGRAFPSPLEVSVTPNDSQEPVDGGVVSFTVPSSGPSAELNISSTATIASGIASVSAVANGMLGTYSVSATTTEATSATFTLSNDEDPSLEVTTTADTVNPSDNLTSLREALAYAATMPASNPKISFAPSLTGTIVLSSGLVISSNVSIIGPSNMPLAVSSTPSLQFSIFTVNAGATVSISDLTISGGFASSGGGVLNHGTLTLADDTFFDDTASNDGGGVSNDGTANLTDDTFAQDSATYGGGFANTGGTATLVNDTITQNAAPNGAGVFNAMAVTLYNTIVANNEHGDDFENNFENPIIPIGSNQVLSSGSHDLIGDGGGNFTDSLSGDPLLSPLGSYGGPTQTYALLPGSAAIAAGAGSIPGVSISNLDQRGMPRFVGPNIDIGAFESSGFKLTVAAGNDQSTQVKTAFPSPLEVSVTPKHSGDPVDGGVVTFTPPVSLASATFSPSAKGTITSGIASVTAVANGATGTYSVSATTAPVGSTTFSLSNDEKPGLVVTTATDAVNLFDGLTSLREALGYAATLGGSQTITFGSGVAGTIELDSGLVISSDVTIEGSGTSPLEVGGGGFLSNFSVFTVNSGVTASISGLTIANGFSGSGGGVFNEGSLTLSDDTITGNSAGTGGGVYNGGTLVLTNDTITQNSADLGGGVDNNGTATFINDTITQNLGASTGGGLYGAVNATLHNTIVALNSSGTVSDPVADQIDGDVSGSYNLIGTGSTGGLTDIDGNQVDVINAGLATGLADNGGPTQTIALVAGSPAIDAGSAIFGALSAPATDQRGALRGPAGLAAGSAPDIGAYEASSSFVVTSTADSGETGTLHAAVDWANVSANANPAATSLTPNTITFDIPSTDAGYSGGVWTITLHSGLTLSNANVPESIVGLGASSLAVAGGGLSSIFSVFTVLANVTAGISGLTVSDGYSQAGGGVYNSGTATLTADTITGNVSTAGKISVGGGGVFNDGTLTLLSDTIIQNTAGPNFQGYGGGLLNRGTATLINDTIAGNFANDGGGVFNDDTITLTNDTIAYNSVVSFGGGLDNRATATLDNTIVALNILGIGFPPVADQIDGNVFGSYDLIGLGEAGGLTNSNGNQVGVANTGLAAGLADNGGPTQTIALLAASPAVDAGSADINGVTVPITDQRGAQRGPAGLDAGSAPDIGAYESSSSYVVTSTADTTDAGTLRAAVEWANVSTNPRPRPVGTAGLPNTITFDIPNTDPGYDGGVWTIALASGLVLSNTSTPESIEGSPASPLVVAGGGSGSDFSDFTVNSDVTASISGLEITNGYSDSGGGVLNDGTLILTSDSVIDNSATGDGGGVDNEGTATLANDIIASNSAADGGGVYNSSTLGLLLAVTLRLTNDTVANNEASANGGGLDSVVTATLLENTIVALNTTGIGLGAAPDQIDGNISGSYNLIGDGNAGGLVNGNGNQVGVFNPGLAAPLSNYGGTIQTIALVPGSPAIDAGDTALAIDAQDNPLTLDERGMPRVVGGAVDIGAFESQGFTLTPLANSTPQSAVIDTKFANALRFTVTANDGIDPVNNGVVTFTPQGSGASATLNPSFAIITSGIASTDAMANGTVGQYSVSGSASGAATENFSLTNLPPLSVTALAPVSPNPRNTAVSSALVTFNEPINLNTFTAGALKLTDNGGSNLITGAVSASLFSGSTYQINGLGGLTASNGNYILTVSAASIEDKYGNHGSGTLSASWLMDTSSPTSHVVNSLGTSQSTDSFPVPVSFNDPAGSGGTPASGVSSVDLYVSVNNGPFGLYQTNTFAPAASGMTTFTVVGQDRNLYAFHSVAHDSAGNTESKVASTVEASTSVPDLNPPVTHILASSPSYSWGPFASSKFSSLTASSYHNGVFTIDWAGADPDQNTGLPSGSIALVNIYANIDGGAPVLIGQPSGGTPNSDGVYAGTMTYNALGDGLSHTYSFYSVGVDDLQKSQYSPAAGPSAPDVTFKNITYSAPFGIQSFAVEKNIAERSFIQYLDVDFNQTLSSSPPSAALQGLAAGLAGSSPSSYVELLWYGENLSAGSTPKGSVNLSSAAVGLSGNDLSINFGPNGITSLLAGAPASPTSNVFGDGWYALGIDASGNPQTGPTFWLTFFRLLGDTNGDGVVTGPYTTAGTDAYTVYHAEGQSGSLLNADVDGSGAVNSKDLNAAITAKSDAVGATAPQSFPAFQLFAGPAAGQAFRAGVTQGQVQALLPEAIAAWRSAGLDATDLRRLEGAKVQVADLGTNILGLEAANVITINETAAGYDWYVNATARSSQALGKARPGGEKLAGPGSPASGRVDLLTVLEHELGHVIGLSDNNQAGDLMDVTLGLGVRRSPTIGDLATIGVAPSTAVSVPVAESSATRLQPVVVDAALESIMATGAGNDEDTDRADRPSASIGRFSRQHLTLKRKHPGGRFSPV